MAKVKKGDALGCAVCGLVVSVDEPCGCAVAEVLCCGKPMAKKKAAKMKVAAAAKKPAKKVGKAAPAKAAAKKPAKKAAKAPAKAAAKKPAVKK